MANTFTQLYIQDNKLNSHRFNWREGYDAFSYRLRDVDEICGYIQNRQEHRRKESFRQEYTNLLKDFANEYEEKYLFEFIDDLHSTPPELRKIP